MVSAIAATPQVTTRNVPRPGDAPPSRAPMKPVSASATSVAATVSSMRVAAGDTITASSGSAAPTVNEAAEAPDAWNGALRHRVSLETLRGS